MPGRRVPRQDSGSGLPARREGIPTMADRPRFRSFLASAAADGLALISGVASAVLHDDPDRLVIKVYRGERLERTLSREDRHELEAVPPGRDVRVYVPGELEAVGLS